jgi:hypothetical protein
MGSSNVTLTAKWNVSKPTITTQPVLPGAIPCNGPITLLIAASGAAPLTYQWYLNGVSMGSSYIGTSISASAGGTYTCIVTDGNGGTLTSNSVNFFGTLTASITTTPVLNATVYSDHVDVCQNGSFYMTATVSGGVPPYTYYWSVDLDDNGFGNPTTVKTQTIVFNESWWDLHFTWSCQVMDSRYCYVTPTVIVNQINCGAGP